MVDTKIDISFILPTNRDPDIFANRVIKNINSLNFNGKTYEIIVVGPKEIKEPNVLFVKENENSCGCVDAYNQGYNASKGEFIILCSDDHFFDLNAPNITDVLNSEFFEKRKYKIICLPTNLHGPCKLPEYCNSDCLIARYPVFKRDTIEKYMNGYIYHPDFKHHYPDNWLGYWMCEQGEPVVEYDKFDMITFNNSCDRNNDDYDEYVFKNLIENYKQGQKKYV
jgi:hypothetical protein